MQTFSVYLRPEDPASGLPEYATCVEARAAWLAKSQAMTMLGELTPETEQHYAEPLLCEDKVGLPRPAMNVLDSTFLKFYCWDDATQQFAERQPQDNEKVSYDGLSPDVKMAVLVRFGTSEINRQQLRDAQQLLTGERDSLEGHMVESLLRARGIAAMHLEAVLELIGELGNNFDGAGQWPGMVKFNESWLRKRQATRKEPTDPVTPLRTQSGATAGGSNLTDRGTGFKHNFDSLRMDIALGLHARAADFDIYNLRSAQVNRARDIIKLKEKPFPAWDKALLATPGILDFSRAIIIYAVKTAPDNIELTPGALQTYINKTLIETDHANPDPEIVAIACGCVTEAEGVHKNETEQKPEVKKHLLAHAAQPAGAVEQNSEQQNGTAPGVAEQPPLEVRTGPFYTRNDAGEVKRANKASGLADLISLGFYEISKTEFQALKNAPADVDFRENRDPTTETFRENTISSTATVQADLQKNPIPGEDVRSLGNGIYEITAIVATADSIASDEGEKTEVTAADVASMPESEPELSAPAFPAVFDFGRYEGVPNSVYHAANGISSSMVKDARISLMYYHGRHVTREIARETSYALTFGTLVHAMALEPEKLDEEFARPFILPQDAVSTTAEMKAIIEKYNAALPPVMSADEIKALLEAHNDALPKPFVMGSSTEETGFLYSSLPEDFQRIGEGEKHTCAAMKACIKEYNATLPAAVKTSGSRDALLTELEKIAPEKADEEREKPQPFNTSGNKDDLAAIVRQIAPDTVFADAQRAQWETDNVGKILIDQNQHDTAQAIREALLAHPSASRLLTHPSRVTETSYFGMDEETGLEVRVRPDIELEINGTRIAADLKTTSMGRVKQDFLRARLHREITERDYHVSAAMYSEVAGFDQFFWVFVNKDPGYHWVAVIEASPDLLELGSLEYHRTLDCILKATETGIWPAPVTDDYADELNDFDLRRLEMLRPV